MHIGYAHLFRYITYRLSFRYLNTLLYKKIHKGVTAILSMILFCCFRAMLVGTISVLKYDKKLARKNYYIRMTCILIIFDSCPLVKSQILELGGLKCLMKMVSSGYPEEATKAMYALSALIRNNLESRELFYAESGGLMLQVASKNSYCNLKFIY